MQRVGDCGTAFAFGWMRVRGHRRRRGFDEGFVLSDHVDWPGLLATIEATGAKKVFATHGYSDTLAGYLREKRTWAEPLETLFAGDDSQSAAKQPETMQRFSHLYTELDRVTSTNGKVAALVDYFRQAPVEDAAWVVFSDGPAA